MIWKAPACGVTVWYALGDRAVLSSDGGAKMASTMRLRRRRRDWLGEREVLYLRVPAATRAEATALARKRGVPLNVLVQGLIEAANGRSGTTR